MIEGVNVELRTSKMSPMEHAVFWLEGFLNDLGGDFTVLEVSDVEAVLYNTASCSSYCGSGNIAQCNDIERAVNRAIKIFDKNLTANFTQCSENDRKGCQMIVTNH